VQINEDNVLLPAQLMPPPSEAVARNASAQFVLAATSCLEWRAAVAGVVGLHPVPRPGLCAPPTSDRALLWARSDTATRDVTIVTGTDLRGT
jgi:hypothetical protein